MFRASPHGAAARPGRSRLTGALGPALLVTALVAALAAATPAGAARERLPGPVPAEVVRVIDGDTIEVRAHIWLGQRVRVRVRLAGVDAPELDGRCPGERELARRARAFVAARVAGRAVVLLGVSYGKYAGRVLATVRAGDGAGAGPDLGTALKAAGLARPYAGRRRAGWC